MGTCISKTSTKAQKPSESLTAQIQLGPSNSGLNSDRSPKKEVPPTNQDTVSALHKEESVEKPPCPPTIPSEEATLSNEASPLHRGELQAVGPALTSFTLNDSTNNPRLSAVSIISSSSSEKDQGESVHTENDEDDTFDSDDDVSLAKPEGRKVSFSGRSVASRSSAATSQSVLALRISSNYYAAGGIVGGVVVGEGDEDSDDEMDPDPESTTTAANAVVVGNTDDNVSTTKEESHRIDGNENEIEENFQPQILPSMHVIDNKRENDLNSFNKISDCEQKNIAEAMPTSSTVELNQSSDNYVINENSTNECSQPVIVAGGDQHRIPDDSSIQDEIETVDVVPTASINDQMNDRTSSINSGDTGDNVNANIQEVGINVNQTRIDNDNNSEANVECGAENGSKFETVRYMSATQVLQQQQRERQLSRSVSRDSQEHEDAKRRHFLQLGRATLVTQHSHSLDNLASKSDNTSLNSDRLSNSDRGKNSSMKNKPNQKQTKISLHQKSVHARQQLGGNSYPNLNINARGGDDKLVTNDNEDK